MNPDENLQPALRQRAGDTLARMGPPEREALLVKGWMSHDARWFMTVAREFGLSVANRLNQRAAREIGTVEARRIVRALGLPAVEGLDGYLFAQELFISLLGPDLLDYSVRRVDDRSCRIEVARCFAHENAVRAGIAPEYDCGIFARIAGWLEALGLSHEMDPPLGRCLKAQERECVHTIGLRPPSAAAPPG